MESRTVQTNHEIKTEKPDNSNKEHEQRKNNESSTKHYLFSITSFKKRNKIHKKNTRHTIGEPMSRDTKRQ